MKRFATIAGASIAAVAVSTSLIGVTAASAAPHGKAGHSRSDRATGEAAQKAIAAALGAVPGTADHAHKNPGGGYRVKVHTTGGKTVVVSLDASFTVTGQQEVPGRTAVTDEERAKASQAALVAVPGGTVLEVVKARDGFLCVLVRTGDGVNKRVRLDAGFAVVSVREAKVKGGKHRRHGGTEVTGEEFTKAESAALTAVPGGTVVDVHKRGTAYHVLVRKSDGTKVVVVLDAGFAVTGTTSFTMKTRR